ncbi:MAG TPA: response regulator transcription factor [Anaerolineales bacterium]
MAAIRVLLVDDHPVVREGIRKLLENQQDITVVGEASEGSQAINMARELSPDVMLLDMELPGIKGTQVAKQLQEEGLSVRILALSAHDDREYIREVLSFGASGYLVKEEVPETIVEAVKGVAYGEQGWVSRRVAAQMSTWMGGGQDKDKRALTPREIEVLKGVVAGKTNQEIGLALGISEKTVEKHLEGVYQKLGVASRVEAAVHAVRQGLT